MKKILKITGVSLLVLLLALLVLPFVFQGKIMKIVKKESNKMLNAKMDFSKLNLSFIRSFPNASIILEDFYIAGINEFSGDTLIVAKEISATVNIKSFFGDSGYEISKFNLENAKIHAIVLENGKTNWDIVKIDSTTQKEDTVQSSNFKLSLQEVSVKNTEIYYDDSLSKINTIVKNINLNLSGDLTAKNTIIETNFTADEMTFIMDKIPYLSKAKITATIRLDADMKNLKFIFSDNQIQINEIKAQLDGWIDMESDESINMDIKLNAPKTQFKDILSMVPAIYSKDFNEIKTSGEVTLNASAKGSMKGDLLPSFDVKLGITNAMFQYPSLPKSVNKINLQSHISNPGGSADKTTIDISNFHFEIADNPFDMNLHIITPVSDPDVALLAVGHIDLGLVKDIYPLEDMELNGKFNANMQVKTRMSYIENEQYDKIQASGTLNVSEMIIKEKGANDIIINKATLTFNPKYIDLSGFSAQIGKNDIAAEGKLENFIPYLFKDETLKGVLSVNSNSLILNDFMSKESSTSQSKTDTTGKMGIIEIPKNIDFSLNGNFKKVVFDKFEMDNLSGQITLKEGRAEMKNLNMNALGGTINANGYYDTSKNPKQPEISMDLDIKNASFAKTFSSFISIQQLAPIFEAIAGNYSTTFNMTAPIDNSFMPVLTSLTASGLLQSSNVEVSNVPTLTALASTLKIKEFNNFKIKDLKLPFSIENGKVTTKPFDINFGSGNKMNLSGTTGLDQSIDYKAKVDLSEKLTKGYVKNMNLKIGGTFKNPKISVDPKNLAEQALNALAGSVLGSGNDSTTLNQKASAETDKQAETIRKQAQDAGTQLIEQAKKQGQNLINEANKTKNPFAKLAAITAAEASAKKLNDEAKKQADKLNAEAEKQIQLLTQKANSQIPK